MSGQEATRNVADKKRRSFWFDPRFAIGIALVVVSVLGVVGLVSAADSSIDVLAARATLTPGQHVTADDLVETSVRAGQVERLYLRESQVSSAGVVITRTIHAGELVPASAVGSATGLQLTSVVVALNSPLPASVGPGSRVDVWSARQDDSNSFAAPTVLVSSAVVVRIVEQKNLVAATTGSSVELLVPKFVTASVLEAIANDAALSVVPVDLAMGQ
jgi:hypothetical protein